MCTVYSISNHSYFHYFFNMYLFFFYLAAPGLSCSTRDLVPRPGIEPPRPALGVWSLSPWTTREIALLFIILIFWPCCKAFRILISQPGIKPQALGLKPQSPTHWTTREFLQSLFLYLSRWTPILSFQKILCTQTVQCFLSLNAARGLFRACHSS